MPLVLEPVKSPQESTNLVLVLMVHQSLYWTAVAMNASCQVTSPELARTIASVATAFRQRFPDGRADLCPWRDDWRTRRWEQPNSIDLGFHFPGWSPRLACRSVLVQLQFKTPPGQQGELLGLVLRGISFQGEQWRLATLGPWQPEGKDTPTEDVSQALQHFCRDVFKLFSAVAS